MPYSCVECKVPVRLPEPGRLFFKHEEQWDSFLYKNLDDEQLQKKLQEQPDAMFGIGLPDSVKPARQFSGADISDWIDNKDVVDVIGRNDFISYLQPIVKADTGEIYGYESLLRTKAEPFIPPGRLFMTAQRLGMHSFLDKAARESAIIARKNHLQDGQKSFINFLPSTIYNPEYCLRHTFQMIEKYGVQPEDLVFEVVETEKIQDMDHLKKVLSVYKREGMKVALDDVGAGFSTIDILEQLQPDYIKIDRSYVSFCDESDEKQDFIGRALDVARQLNIHTLAEGIERQEELEYCRKMGVGLAQGYLLGRPSPVPETPVIQ